MIIQACNRVFLSATEMDALIAHVRSQAPSTAVSPAKAKLARYVSADPT